MERAITQQHSFQQQTCSGHRQWRRTIEEGWSSLEAQRQRTIRSGPVVCERSSNPCVRTNGRQPVHAPLAPVDVRGGSLSLVRCTHLLLLSLLSLLSLLLASVGVASAVHADVPLGADASFAKAGDDAVRMAPNARQ